MEAEDPLAALDLGRAVPRRRSETHPQLDGITPPRGSRYDNRTSGLLVLRFCRIRRGARGDQELNVPATP
jgi:hypothetical protein